MLSTFYSKPACDYQKLLLIEVTGFDHRPGQDFAFFDAQTGALKPELTARKELDKAFRDLSIYGWDWRDQRGGENDVCLQVTTDQAPIYLPLFPKVEMMPREMDQQPHQLQSVVPLTLLPSLDEQQSLQARLAPVRSGFLYLFWQGKFWRELAVDAEQGRLQCQDVDLAQHRDDTGQFQSGPRPAVGHALEEIWFPTLAGGRKVAMQFAFSEVQWSGARLNYLEARTRLRRLGGGFHPHFRTSLLKTAQLAPMRWRDPGQELNLAEPSRLNHDLSGEAVHAQYQTLKQQIDQARQRGKMARGLLRSITLPTDFEFAQQQQALNGSNRPG